MLQLTQCCRALRAAAELAKASVDSEDVHQPSGTQQASPSPGAGRAQTASEAEGVPVVAQLAPCSPACSMAATLSWSVGPGGCSLAPTAGFTSTMKYVPNAVNLVVAARAMGHCCSPLCLAEAAEEEEAGELHGSSRALGKGGERGERVFVREYEAGRLLREEPVLASELEAIFGPFRRRSDRQERRQRRRRRVSQHDRFCPGSLPGSVSSEP